VHSQPVALQGAGHRSRPAAFGRRSAGPAEL